MAECRDLESLFAAYVDGEAAPGDCAVIDAHVRGCAVCRNRVARERVVREAVAARRDALRGCATGEFCCCRLSRTSATNRYPLAGTVTMY